MLRKGDKKERKKEKEIGKIGKSETNKMMKKKGGKVEK